MAYGISLAKALKAALKVRVFVSIVVPRPSIATAPSGSGVVMMPTMVARKMARRCHAWAVTPRNARGNEKINGQLPWTKIRHAVSHMQI